MEMLAESTPSHSDCCRHHVSLLLSGPQLRCQCRSDPVCHHVSPSPSLLTSRGSLARPPGVQSPCPPALRPLPSSSSHLACSLSFSKLNSCFSVTSLRRSSMNSWPLFICQDGTKCLFWVALSPCHSYSCALTCGIADGFSTGIMSRACDRLSPGPGTVPGTQWKLSQRWIEGMKGTGDCPAFSNSP